MGHVKPIQLISSFLTYVLEVFQFSLYSKVILQSLPLLKPFQQLRHYKMAIKVTPDASS